MGASVSGIDKETIEILKQREWPGNVRELRNAIERAMNFTTDNILDIDDFNLEAGELLTSVSISDMSKDKGKRLLDQAKNKAEREVILKVLSHFNNNKSKTAEYLGIARPLLYQKMKRLGIK